jgi:hypothetical protein
MSAESAEVRGLLSVLGEKVSTCREPLGAQEVGNALYGLQGMSSESAEVRGLLSVLGEKVSTCREPLGAQEVGNALYGLQGMNSKYLDASVIRDKICGKLDDSIFLGNNFKVYSQIILGLCAFPGTEETTTLMEKMLRDLKDASATSTSLDVPMSLAASLRLLVELDLPFFRSLPTGLKAKLQSVLALIISRERSGTGIQIKKTNVSERFYEKMAIMAFAGYREKELIIRIERNVNLYDFEADIVVTIESAASAQQHPPLVINFEIDGPVHAHAAKKRYCAIRDKYLALHGVPVKRINLAENQEYRILHGLSKADYAEAVMKAYRIRASTELIKRGWQLEEVQESG